MTRSFKWLLIAILLQQVLSETTDWASVFRDFAAAERTQQHAQNQATSNAWLDAFKNFPSR